MFSLPDTERPGSEWVMVGMANNRQRGTSERIREKMLKISEMTRAVIEDKADTQQLRECLSLSQANERSLQERAEEAEVVVREERQRTQEAERRYVYTNMNVCLNFKNTLHYVHARALKAEQRAHYLEATLRDSERTQYKLIVSLTQSVSFCLQMSE